jgi:serine phosphatase RsbU (regulator of sigma subunit)/anti-sigma regulatory factor (Ser/Thr protein kinase)
MSAAALSAASAAAPAAKGHARARVSLRVLVPLASALLLAGALLAGALVSERQTRGMLVTQARTRLALEAELLARASSSAMLEGFPELTLQPILSDLLRGRKDLATAMVIDRDGRILAHPDSRQIGKTQPLPGNTGVLVNGARLREEGASFVAVMPIRHASGSVLGDAIVVMPRAPLEHALADARARQWVIAALLVLVSGAITFVLMARLLRPIERLREGLERIGHGDLDTRLALADGTELGLLADTLDDMAGRLATAQRSQLERERLATEFEAAGRIQTSLRPRGPVRRGTYVVTGHQRPAAEVGGDYFDAVELPDGRLGLVIADVSGKGLAGCLVTFMLAALVRVTREHETSPSRLLMEVDQYLRPVLERGAFVTVWYGVLDPLTGDVTFASAGHLPTFIRRADGSIERHETKGIPLGLLNSRALAKGLRDVTTRLHPGDVLLQVTDGFTEAAGADGSTQLGFEGVTRALEQNGTGDADALIARLCRDVEDWTQGASPDDDQTVIVLRRDPAQPAVQAVPAFADRDASVWLMAARASGSPLVLNADLAQLEMLPEWLQDAPDLAALSPCALRGMESALYELCANVMEHGYELDGEGRLELWWLPEHVRASAASCTHPRARGWFVLLERGRVFDPSTSTPADLSDRAARLKGRGLGMAMLHRLLSSVRYQPSLPEGNVTLLEVDSDHIQDVVKGEPDARCA